MKLVSLFALASLSLGLLAGCSGAGDDASEPVGDPSQDEIVKAANGNWDCAADDDSSFAIEELTVSTSKKGTTKAYLDMSGPGDFLETFSYKTTVSTSGGSIVVKGTNFELTIASKADPKTKDHSAQLTAVGPKRAELYAGETITSKMSCSPRK